MIDQLPGDNFEFTCVICDFGFANFVNDSERKLVAGFRKPLSSGITIRYAAPEVSNCIK